MNVYARDYGTSCCRRCYVTVKDSDQAVGLYLDPEPDSAGDTFQAVVRDKTGKNYPAVFTSARKTAEITPDGHGTCLEAGKFGVKAKLEDGRELEISSLTVYASPIWMKYPDVVISPTSERYAIGWIETDAGNVRPNEVTVTVEDENAVKWNGQTCLEVVNPGETNVTLQSKYSDAKVPLWYAIVLLLSAFSS